MTDVVVTVPADRWLFWLTEGDLPDDPESGVEYHFKRSSSAGPTLNPRFVEYLMGLPLGWTDYAVPGTESYRWWRLTHSSRLAALLESHGLRP